MCQQSKHELVWAAGFFDGEGSTVCPSAGKHLLLTIHQVNRDNLYRFRAAVGGRGNVSRPYDRGTRPISAYRAYGEEAHDVVMLLWPFLGSEKRDQALRALLKYSFRSVRHRAGLASCARGHVYSAVGMYVDPHGNKECAECRRMRRNGTLSPAPKQTAIGCRIGIREYVPPSVQTAHEAVAWTFGREATAYAPAVQT